MNKSAQKIRALRLATDICNDYSIGQRVFAYLENTLTSDAEISEFAKHAGECTFCMQTMIKWHYDSIVTEASFTTSETTFGTQAQQMGFQDSQFSPSFDFTGSNHNEGFEDTDPDFDCFKDFSDNEISH